MSAHPEPGSTIETQDDSRLKRQTSHLGGLRLEA